MTALEVLKKARGLIDKHWVKNATKQGMDRLPDGTIEYGYCAIGAIGEAQGFDWQRGWDAELSRHGLNWSQLIAMAGFAKIGLNGREPMQIPSWNDADCRTKAHVLRAFDKAIAHAETCADAQVDHPDAHKGLHHLIDGIKARKAAAEKTT